MARVQLDGLRKVYDGGHVAVHGATLDVQDGEFLVLVGPSGCGKSTTLRMIAGLEDITAGRLYIGDRLVNDVAPKDRDIAMVFQNYALYPHMSVYDNIAFGLKLRRYAKSEIRRRVEEAAALLGIGDVLERKPKQLSGGQRQRVAVGRAIVRKPEVFLFDEPLSNLDAKLRAQTRTELSKLHRRLGTTMIYVTHDQVEAMTMGDRIVVLEGGRIQQVDTPLALYGRPANRFVAGFIGSPSMNFIPGRLVNERGLRFTALDGAFSIRLDGEGAGRPSASTSAYAGREITLGIRPEDVHVAGQPAPHAMRGPHTPPHAVEADFTVEVLEPMGNEIIAYARAADQAVVARVAPQPMPEPGQPVRLAFDAGKLHFFDAETGEAV